MAKTASSPELQKAFQQHLEQTHGQIERARSRKREHPELLQRC